METLLTISGIFLVLFLILTFVTANNSKADWVPGVFALLATISLLLLIYASIRIDNRKPVEYKVSEYSLELKVTEYKGQMDTTYVLIPKK